LLDADEAVVIRVRHELEPSAQRLLVSLGAGWVVDAVHGERCVSHCGWSVCSDNEEVLMDEAAHTATQSRSCKIAGCPHESVARLGKFAGLCSDHIDARRRSGVDAPATNGASAPRAPRSGGPSGLAEKVATLGKVGRDVDKLRAQARTLTERALTAKARADEAEREFSRARPRADGRRPGVTEAVVNHPGERRQRLAREAAELRAAGLLYDEIGEALGISRSYASALLLDPTGTLGKQRKQRYRQPCVDCGAVTSGAEGRKETPRCQPCAAWRSGAAQQIWTPGRVIEAIQDWAAIYGEPPSSVDWNPWAARHVVHDEERARRWERADGRWPWFTIVHQRFGSFSEGLLAAGFQPRDPVGSVENQKRRRSMRQKATA